jgi:putative acetyltransferase
VIIRHEIPADAAAVRSIVSAAFGSQLEADLVDALRPLGGDRLSFVAERSGAVVGHVMCTPSLLDAPERLVDVLTLAPLAVAPAHQRTGVGRALVAHALRAAQEAGSPLVFLEGDWRYYGRLGFRRADELEFRAPSLRIPAPAFQVATLTGYEPWMTGTLVYPEVFWRLDCVGLRGDDLAEVMARPDAH